MLFLCLSLHEGGSLLLDVGTPNGTLLFDTLHVTEQILIDSGSARLLIGMFNYTAQEEER